MPKQVKPKLPWRASLLSVGASVTAEQQAALRVLAQEIAPEAADSLTHEVVKHVTDYRLFRRYDSAERGEQNADAAPSAAQVCASIMALDAALGVVRDCLRDLDQQSKMELQFAAGGVAKYADDVNALRQLHTHVKAAIKNLPVSSGRPGRNSLVHFAQMLADTFAQTTGIPFSVGRGASTIESFNRPAYWVARVISIVEPDISASALRTAFKRINKINVLQ